MPIKTRKPTKEQRRENKELYSASASEQRALADAGFRVHSSLVRMLPH